MLPPSNTLSEKQMLFLMLSPSLDVNWSYNQHPWALESSQKDDHLLRVSLHFRSQGQTTGGGGGRRVG